MLDLMRRKKRLRLILWVVIAALAFSMLIFFVPGSDMGGFLDNPGVVATVAGRDISGQAFARQYSQIARNISAANNIDSETLRKMGFPRQVLDDLIKEALVETLADNFGIDCTEAEMRRLIENNPNFQDKGKFIGVENYKALLAANNFTASEFESQLRRQWLMEKVRDMITSALTVSDKQLRDSYERSTQKIQADYILLKKENYKKLIKPSDADIQKWFDSHKDTYNVSEKRRADYVMVPMMQFVSQVKVSEDDVLKEWNSVSHAEVVEAAHILFLVNDPAKEAEVKKTAEEVLAKAKAGQDFASLARKYSEDTGSAQQGGYLGPFRRGDMVKEFEDAAFALPVNQISDLVRTQYGYHIIKVLRHETPTLETARAELSAMVMQRKIREMARQKADEVAAAIAGQPDLKAAVKNLGFTVEVREIPLMAKTDNAPTAEISQSLIDEVFALKEVNAVGKPVETPLGYAIPRLREVQLARPGVFEEFRAQAASDYTDAKAKELMDAEAQKLSADGIKNSSLATAAKAMGLTVKTTQEFTRSGTPDPEIGANTTFNQAAFALATGAVSAPQPLLENVVVFQVKSRSPFDEAAFEKQKSALHTQLLNNLQDTYFEEYINRRLEAMEKDEDIYINNRALEQIASTI